MATCEALACERDVAKCTEKTFGSNKNCFMYNIRNSTLTTEQLGKIIKFAYISTALILHN